MTVDQARAHLAATLPGEHGQPCRYEDVWVTSVVETVISETVVEIPEPLVPRR